MKINRNIISQPSSHNNIKDNLQSNTIPVINVSLDIRNINHKDEIK